MDSVLPAVCIEIVLYLLLPLLTTSMPAMRKCHSLFIMLFSLVVVAQQGSSSNEPVVIRQLPPKGILLDKGWKYQAGDNAAYAAPDFDDSRWQSIDPTLELPRLPQLKEAGMGWFRLTLQVDSSLTGKMLSMAISTIGASEIYLNGRLLYRLGKVSKDYKEEQTRIIYALPISMKFDRQSSQVLAVRYSFNQANLYLKATNIPPCMGIVLKYANQNFTESYQGENLISLLRSIQLSFYLPLGILLLFLFYSFPNRREYLYFGLFCLSLFASNLLQVLALLPSLTVSQSMVLLLLLVGFLLLGYLSFINGTRILYKFPKNWFFKAVVLYASLVIPLWFLFNEWGGLLLQIFGLLIAVDLLYLNFHAVRLARPGAWILFTTAVLMALGVICLSWFYVAGNIYLFWVVYSMIYMLPTIGLSLFTAGDFARTGLALQSRVAEVEDLSEKTIAQEKEKQQLLASQNETLERDVAQRTAQLQHSLQELKETQSQLVQREKMASLGELTAGIAHEIQNPLNFVNNFSETNKELVAELKQELRNQHYQEVETIATDIENNEEKINHHGKRADSIVKGMLQHARKSSGEKQPTDINKLADEYLRLSYQGMQAKNKEFTATIQTHFDPNLGEAYVVPQDIGRVLLNLFNNAFYAVSEKKRQGNGTYEPVVEVSTKGEAGNIVITVKDNGTGIPEQVASKVFQPFFTTKPTGEGTGLGLSLSYDIITKGHGGELKVKSREGEGSEFVVQLPIQKAPAS
jgi:signal transduction histidine kinase